MGLLQISKILLAALVPFIIILSAANYLAFDKQYYARKMPEHQANFPEATAISDYTIDFVSGKSDKLPGIYNEREVQHLNDVRNFASTGKSTLYFSASAFAVGIFLAFFASRRYEDFFNFLGSVLFFGGVIAIGILLLALLVISLNFTSSFESFHKIFFEQGTYAFDPQNEIIVNLYTEQIFMDLGKRIAGFALFEAVLSAIIGLAFRRWKKIKRIKN